MRKNVNEFEDMVKGVGKIKYKILNPGGNKTALVKGNDYTNIQKKLINNAIIDKNLQVEQVGFLSDKVKRLEMAGGEFCVNGTRCAVFEYLKGKEGETKLSVSGTNKKILGRVKNGKVELELGIGKNIKDIVEVRNEFICIKLDGILIAVLDEKNSKAYISCLKENEEETKSRLKQVMINKLDTKEKAIGIMLIEKSGDITKINPVVWVKEIDTVFYETACGSGSIGVAIYSYLKDGNKKINLLQPSNYIMNIEFFGNEDYIEKAIICGVVEEE